jgi:hypothetical protein
MQSTDPVMLVWSGTPRLLEVVRAVWTMYQVSGRENKCWIKMFGPG